MGIFYKHEWDEENHELTLYINSDEAFYEFAAEYAGENHIHPKRKTLLEAARYYAGKTLAKGTPINSYRIKFQQFLIAVLEEKNGSVREVLEGPTFGYIKIKEGDTLKDIAHNLDMDEMSLKSANSITSDTVFVGMELKVPCYHHIVVMSDSLYKIANKYDVSKEAIRILNKLHTDCLQIGQALIIPKRTK
ncbi:D-gamma-glutamyl-meso-diaminopimelic acid endopeptidase CwlS precursor [Bacillus sp. THAF10]|uniref:LysM peptidoglycan-binding domain-containing protein n=1 Tax=Bacillus sp. THAF10 TaxID=2587848 RepID=UPI001267F6B9|nr:LysM peptidoglycan-binding domain-containing protein [Bacillus sp. THAF10]QFT88672.1 D-gamma-glutamyl-meso-diaminopimelic acid endopeptidase CwlS precursor [Bacillus sp. THAF10]